MDSRYNRRTPTRKLCCSSVFIAMFFFSALFCFILCSFSLSLSLSFAFFIVNRRNAFSACSKFRKRSPRADHRTELKFKLDLWRRTDLGTKFTTRAVRTIFSSLSRSLPPPFYIRAAKRDNNSAPWLKLPRENSIFAPRFPPTSSENFFRRCLPDRKGRAPSRDPASLHAFAWNNDLADAFE